MTQQETPWENLSRLIEADDRAGIAGFLDGLPPGDIPRVLAGLTDEQRIGVLRGLGAEEAADLVEQLPEVQAAEIIEDLEPREVAAILHELPSNEQADLLSEMEPEDAQAVLAAMDPAEAEIAFELANYPADVAGGLMRKEFLVYRDDMTVAGLIDDLRSGRETYQDYHVLYAYLIDSAKRLSGVVRLRNLLLSPPELRLKELALPARSLHVLASLDDLESFFDQHGFLAVPVVDASQKLMGVIRRSDVEEAVVQRSDSDYRKSQGIVGGEELRTMPLFLRSGRRLSWLSVNIVLNIIAASVIALYQETLTAVIALAVFLPIISDMSGCSGNQAVAVSIREMTMGVVKPADVFRVWWKEISVGLINGVVLGILVGGAAWLWKRNLYLGLVCGGALALNTMVAVSIGGLVPLVLKRFKMDPALASGPILTTVTDMCGFFLVLSLATLLLSKLTVI